MKSKKFFNLSKHTLDCICGSQSGWLTGTIFYNFFSDQFGVDVKALESFGLAEGLI